MFFIDVDRDFLVCCFLFFVFLFGFFVISIIEDSVLIFFGVGGFKMDIYLIFFDLLLFFIIFLFIFVFILDGFFILMLIFLLYGLVFFFMVFVRDFIIKF